MKARLWHNSMHRSVYAHLVDRFFFNFRAAPEDVEARLPVRWLKPQVVNGYSVVSFCIVRLAGLTMHPLPFFTGVQTVSCAFRCGVIDASGSSPSVYIMSRNTDLPLLASAGRLILKNPMPLVRTAFSDNGLVQSCSLEGQTLFSASTEPSSDPMQLGSQVFDSLGSCVKFIHDGSSSYTQSVYRDHLARIDVQKQDLNYRSINARIGQVQMDGVWQDLKMDFDSAVRTNGGIYKWTFLRLVPHRMHANPYQLCTEMAS